MNHAKALGLALLAVLALSAALSQSAQAAEITAPAYPATLTGKDVQTAHGKLTRFTIGNGARFIECTVKITRWTLFSEKASRENITTHGEFIDCFANGLTAVPATVTMNGCDFTDSLSNLIAGTISVMCPAGKAIQIHIYENETKQKEGIAFCTYDIAEAGNTGLGSLSFAAGTLDGVADLTVGLNIKEIKTQSTIGSAGLCGIASGVTGNSSIVGTETLTGETGAGVAQAVMTQ